MYPAGHHLHHQQDVQAWQGDGVQVEEVRGQQPPWIVPDGLWQRIEPLLPRIKPRNPRRPGRTRLDDRKVLCGTLL